MIVLKLQGGLGNQMFEYAFGRAVQEITGQELLLDISGYAKDGLRQYSLDHFKLSDRLVVDDSGKYNQRYDQRENPLIHIGTRFLPEMLFRVMSKRGIYIWDYVRYKEVQVTPREGDIYLHGYWQGYDYFAGIIDLIRNELSVVEPIMSDNVGLYENIRSSNSVCVHIRRGDFLLTTNKLYNCSNRYFLDGMKALETKYDNLTYFIFSDDIADVKRNFDFRGHNVFFVEKHNPDYEELRLMYSCRHFIISNSTFSWWAANLSEREDKTVIAPKEWYTDHRDVSHLLNPDWTILKN